MKALMFLNDGETFTSLDGCFIALVPDDWDTDRIEQGMAERDEAVIVDVVFREDSLQRRLHHDWYME